MQRKKLPGRPKSEELRKTIALRLPPDLLSSVDQVASENFQERTNVVEISLRAMLRRGFIKTLEDAQQSL